MGLGRRSSFALLILLAILLSAQLGGHHAQATGTWRGVLRVWDTCSQQHKYIGLSHGGATHSSAMLRVVIGTGPNGAPIQASYLLQGWQDYSSLPGFASGSEAVVIGSLSEGGADGPTIQVESLRIVAAHRVDWSLRFAKPRPEVYLARRSQLAMGHNASTSAMHTHAAVSWGVHEHGEGEEEAHSHDPEHHHDHEHAHDSHGHAHMHGEHGHTHGHGHTHSNSHSQSHRRATEVKTGLKVLVIRPRFPAGCAFGPTGACDDKQWRTVLKDLGQYSIGNTLNACTWGAISIASVDVSPLVDVNCVTKRSSCGLTADAMQVEADNAVAKLGLYRKDPQTGRYLDYDHVVFDLPQLGTPEECNNMAAKAELGGQSIATNANCDADTVMHEMGHNYGLNHSGLYYPDQKAVDVYGDLSCVMGGSEETPWSRIKLKCFSMPQVTSLGGLGKPQVVPAASLPAGGVTTFKLRPHWEAPTQGLLIRPSDFGGTGGAYYISYEWETGPNRALSERSFVGGEYAGVVLLHQRPVNMGPAEGDMTVRFGLLHYGGSYTIPGLNIVVRISSYNRDRSEVTVSLCRRGGTNTCAAAPAAEEWKGTEFIRFRTSKAPGYCLAVCDTAAGTGCQPAGYDVTKQRAIVLKKDGCTDDWSLWMLQGHRIRNKQTGWCMDTSLLGRLANSFAAIVARPCALTTDGQQVATNQQFFWKVNAGAIAQVWSQGLTYTQEQGLNQIWGRNEQDQYSNFCPSVCPFAGASCNNQLPVPITQRGPTGGLYSMFVWGQCLPASGQTFKDLQFITQFEPELADKVPITSGNTPGPTPTPSPTPSPTPAPTPGQGPRTSPPPPVGGSGNSPRPSSPPPPAGVPGTSPKPAPAPTPAPVSSPPPPAGGGGGGGGGGNGPPPGAAITLSFTCLSAPRNPTETIKTVCNGLFTTLPTALGASASCTASFSNLNAAVTITYTFGSSISATAFSTRLDPNNAITGATVKTTYAKAFAVMPCNCQQEVAFSDSYSKPPKAFKVCAVDQGGSCVVAPSCSAPRRP